MSVRLTRNRIDIGELERLAASGAVGAICTFQGTVRAEGSEDPLVALEYSAYEEMALREMERVRAEALAKFPVIEVFLVHRLGRLAVGEVSVAVVVSAAHRDAAFAACRYSIDEIKAKAPIWKKEIRASGRNVWVDPGRGA
jgi:molybdopterin synthase catalytic subunit